MNRNDLLLLALMQVYVSRLWTTVASIVIAFSFIFGTSIRQMYESVIFLLMWGMLSLCWLTTMW